MPKLYIIAGCNGAGKTTASFTVLPEMLNCKEFVNADEIARGLSPFNPASVAIEAGRLMIERIGALVKQAASFAFETTLATKSYKKLIEQMQKQNYFVSLLFFWLPSPEQAIQRVKFRVSQGGHNIPEDVIRRRYANGLFNLFEIYMPLCDYWCMYDNSGINGAKTIAYGTKDKERHIILPSLYDKIRDDYGRNRD